MKILVAASILSLPVASATLFAQEVDFLIVNKQQTFNQTNDTTAVATATPWRFRAMVEGTNTSGIVASLTTPGGTGSTTFSHDASDDVLEVVGSYATQGEMDAAYNNGSYGFTVHGQTVSPIDLSGDFYPAAPIATVTGGTISGGTLLWDPSQDLTITISGVGIDHFGVYVFGSNYNDGVETFGGASLSFTVPAFSLAFGTSYQAELNFDNIVGADAPFVFGGTGDMATVEYAGVYSAMTKFNIQVIPEPASYATILGALALAGLATGRRRR